MKLSHAGICLTYRERFMDQISDAILKKAAEGDVAAFEQIYRAYAPFVYNVAFRMLQRKEDAEEVVQEVFVAVHGKLNGFMFRSSLKTWVYRITANHCINHLNKHKRHDKGRVDLEDVIGSIGTLDETHAKIEREDHEYKVARLLEVLNPEEKACVVLRSIEGLSYEEISRSLNVNINTVRTRLKRGREKMMAQSLEDKQ